MLHSSRLHSAHQYRQAYLAACIAAGTGLISRHGETGGIQSQYSMEEVQPTTTGRVEERLD